MFRNSNLTYIKRAMHIENRNYFRLTRFIILWLPPVFRLLARFRSPSKRILIVKTDAIGDYILFRNFIELVKISKRFTGCKVDLVGNKTWAGLALAYDRDLICNYYFVSPDPLYEQPGELLKLCLRLFKNNYAAVLHPTFSRTLIGDGLSILPAAKETIGFESDAERINPKYKKVTDRQYTQLLTLPAVIKFEFDRYKYFFSSILSEELYIERPFSPVTDGAQNGIIVFPGAGVSKRCWEREKFLEIIKRIIQTTPHTITLAGGEGDIEAGNWLTNRLPAHRVLNKIGQTSLTELAGLIGNSQLLICNETSAIHIAVAIQTPSVCILGGGHFGRFAPYPQGMKHAPVCIYKKMDCFNCNWECIYKIAQNETFPCISAVNTDLVWAAVKKLL